MVANVQEKMGSQGNPDGSEPDKFVRQYSSVILTLHNVLYDKEKLNTLPSLKDGLSLNDEKEIRMMGCDMICTAGILLKLPQVAIGSAQVIFQRYFHSASFIRREYEHAAMACLNISAKIEEAPRRVRDIINVFTHIYQVRSGKTIQPLILDQSYVNLKQEVIKAERRILKELGFCVHIKQPHKIIFMYLEVLEKHEDTNLVQKACIAGLPEVRKWRARHVSVTRCTTAVGLAGQALALQPFSAGNYMNDSFRTNVFLRFTPGTIACACIFLSARMLQVALPEEPSWVEVFGASQEHVHTVAREILAMYSMPKLDTLRLNAEILRLKKEEQEERQRKRLKRIEQLKDSAVPSGSASGSTSPNFGAAARVASPAADAPRDRVPPLIPHTELRKIKSEASLSKRKPSSSQTRNDYSHTNHDRGYSSSGRDRRRRSKDRDHHTDHKRRSPARGSDKSSQKRDDKYRVRDRSRSSSHSGRSLSPPSVTQNGKHSHSRSSRNLPKGYRNDDREHTRKRKRASLERSLSPSRRKKALSKSNKISPITFRDEYSKRK